MRKIKFRAWYPEEGRMEYQDNKTPEWLGDILTNSHYIPMQYTGLRDNNDKELYFDDIINKYYGNKLSSKEAVENFDDLVRLYLEILENGMNFEIIDNTHENPELLSK